MVLPWHNPVLLAEQAATLELLSGGRLDLGVGKGYRYAEFNGFNIPIKEAEARFDECLDTILKGWTSKQRFSHHGRFWNFNEIVVKRGVRSSRQPTPCLTRTVRMLGKPLLSCPVDRSRLRAIRYRDFSPPRRCSPPTNPRRFRPHDRVDATL